MTLRQVHSVPFLLLLICALLPIRTSAQNRPWTTSLRGSWVQTGPAAQGDLILAGRDSTAEIVVGAKETSVRIWQLVRDANASLEQLEVELHRAEYPPFDRWYDESWIRSTLNESNPHRPYIQVRTFISSEGHGRVARGQPVTGPR